MSWTCPKCGRTFGRANQPHSCKPPVPVADWLAGRDPLVAEVLDIVTGYLRGLGPILVEPTKSAVMIKRSRTFAEIKPKRDHVDLAFVVSRKVDDPRIARTLAMSPARIAHVVEIRGAGEIDETVRAWLAEAFESSPV